MKAFITNILLILSFLNTFSQDTITLKYWIGFKDKRFTQYSLNNPQEFLSQRAIDRRLRYNIAIDSTDLPVNKVYLDSISHIEGVTITTKSKWLNGCVIKITDSTIIDSISQFSFVNDIKRIYVGVSTMEVKNNIYKKNIKGDYGYANAQIYMLNLDVLHNKNYYGEGMVIAILDAGFKEVNQFSYFDSLFEYNRILGGFDFVDNDTTIFEKSNHGTGVLSTMGANIPGELVGTSPHANFWLLISEDANSEHIVEEYNWVAAAEFADSVGADLINSSLGYSTFDDSTQNHTYQQLDGNTTPSAKAANIAFSKGMIVVTSAGNSGDKPWHYITTPGDAIYALTVGAVDIYGEYASFSSTGPTPDGRIKPDVVALGAPAAVCYNGDSISLLSGTSFSSPIVCGAIACLWQAFKQFDNSTIIDAVKRSSSQYFSPDSLYGYGIPDFAVAYDYLYQMSSFGEENIKKDKGFFIFPNPVKDKLNITFFYPHDKKFIMIIYDIYGNVISSADFSSYGSIKTLSIPNIIKLKKGIYTIKFILNDKVFYDKFIKI